MTFGVALLVGLSLSLDAEIRSLPKDDGGISASQQSVGQAWSVSGARGGSVRTVSARVVAMWQASGTKAGPATLTYLVLWRGKPGWFVHDSVTVGASGPANMQRRFGVFGPLEIAATLDTSKAIIRIQDKDVKLD